ncbi:myosin I [Parelaphostrongylus tenuis]|uniref:Myosin I n=1 Tax=Parelaphostrongylus tenuis TaxID=148309 RepID=A0AAD5MNK9_PARTN|nr:myosin I [Parelaphostrongylus tenuis]
MLAWRSGVLHFETPYVTSFEQFHINYANEKLQQYYKQSLIPQTKASNKSFVQLEQEEYGHDGITCFRIDYYGKRPTIDMIELKSGPFEYFDEKCKVYKALLPSPYIIFMSNANIVMTSV